FITEGHTGTLPQPDPSVPKHPHPGAIFLPLCWIPGVLNCAEHTLRVRHHDRNPAIGIGYTCNPEWRSVRVSRVTFCHLPVVIDITKCNFPAMYQGSLSSICLKLRAACPVGNSDRHTGAGHSLQKCRAGIADFYHGNPSLKSLRAVFNKPGPLFATRYNLG